MTHTHNSHEHRSTHKWLLGVCAECAKAWHISVYWLRAICVLCSLLSFGLFGFVYLWMYLSMKGLTEQDSHQAVEQSLSHQQDLQFIETVRERLLKHQQRLSDQQTPYHSFECHK